MAKSVLIIGSGIIGAAFALQLTLAGASVTLIERQAEAGGLATPASWAWINASFFNAEPYARLRHRAMAEWRALADGLPGLAVQWPGSFLWQEDGAELELSVAAHAAWGYDCAMIEAREVARREPNLLPPPGPAAFSRSEGVINPIKATAHLLDAAEKRGAMIRTGLTATALEVTGDRVTGVRTPHGHIQADEVVLCAGATTNDLLRPLGREIRLDNQPGLVVLSHRTAPLIRHLLITPSLELRQDAEGRVIAAGDVDVAKDPLEAALTLMEAVRPMLRGGAGLRQAKYRAALRPMTADGLPAFGRTSGIAGLWMAVTHSGVTLAPLLARLGAEALLTGAQDAMLSPYGPDRLLS